MSTALCGTAYGVEQGRMLKWRLSFEVVVAFGLGLGSIFLFILAIVFMDPAVGHALCLVVLCRATPRRAALQPNPVPSHSALTVLSQCSHSAPPVHHPPLTSLAPLTPLVPRAPRTLLAPRTLNTCTCRSPSERRT